VVVRKDGSLLARPPLSNESHGGEHWSWSSLDLSSSYGDYVCAQVEELCDLFRPDGFWFDIVWPEPNYSPSGLTRAHAGGVADATSVTSMRSWARAQMLAFMAETSAREEASSGWLRIPRAWARAGQGRDDSIQLAAGIDVPVREHGHLGTVARDPDPHPGPEQVGRTPRGLETKMRPKVKRRGPRKEDWKPRVQAGIARNSKAAIAGPLTPNRMKSDRRMTAVRRSPLPVS